MAPDETLRLHEARVGNPGQQHGGGGMFAAGKVQATPYAPAKPAHEALESSLPSWLTSPQRQAVNAWLSRDQGEIHQAAINNDKGPWAGVIQNLDAAISGSPVTTSDQVVYRIFPPTEKLTQGDVVRSPGFMATSPTPLAGGAQIHIPAGSQVLQLPGEVLLPRGTQLQVQSSVPGHAPQMTVFSGKTGNPPKVENPTRSFWLALMTRATNEDDREAIRKRIEQR